VSLPSSDLLLKIRSVIFLLHLLTRLIWIDAFWLETISRALRSEEIQDAWTWQTRKCVVECFLCERKSWSLIWLLLLYLPGIAHGSVYDEIRRGMLYQARSRWKLYFAVCSSVRSGADINLTSYEVRLKSSTNASAKQRQMTFVELNSYFAVAFHSV